VEIQGTAEGEPFGDDDLADLLRVGRVGIERLLEIQRAHLPEGLLAR
jgi:ribonuclease PH